MIERQVMRIVRVEALEQLGHNHSPLVGGDIGNPGDARSAVAV